MTATPAHEDRAEILDIIHVWTDIIDRGRWEDYEALYTDDATIDFSSIGSAGTDPASHREFLEDVAWPAVKAQQHLVGNTIFESYSSDSAATRTTCLASVVMPDGALSTIAVWYLDDWSKVDGRWLIDRRVCEKNFISPETWVNPAQAD